MVGAAPFAGSVPVLCGPGCSAALATELEVAVANLTPGLIQTRLGGSLRQAGIVAAACTYALDHNIARLAEDHDNAKVLARGLAQLEGITVEDPETNLVFFDIKATGKTQITVLTKAQRDEWKKVMVASHSAADRINKDMLKAIYTATGAAK